MSQTLKNAKMYCKDDLSKIENFDKSSANNFVGWQVHHRLETNLEGEVVVTADTLKRLGMYFDRPYFELIFLTVSDHRKLHKNHTEESIRRIKARTPKIYGRPTSDSTRKLMSIRTKEMMQDPNVRYNCGSFTRGKHWKLEKGKRVYYV